ncbi:MAG: pseudouridine synthase, partial [Phycisphaerales bacterium]|nr:pseudouridine synthase [Phycisphaerales bacterium]
ERMVEEGRITVNGQTVTRLPVMVDPQHDRVTIDGQPVRLRRRPEEPRVYVLLNKPRHVYCTNRAQGEQRRAIDLLPRDFPRVFPVGRLDQDSRGLLLLTNDGELTYRLTHPKFEVPKTYLVTIDGSLSGEAIEKIRRGVWLADRRTGRAFKTGRGVIRILQRGHDRTTLEVTLREGRNREVRRMLAKVGHKVRDLVRIRFGPLTLEGLGPGKWRLLSPGEIRRLHQACQTEHPPQDRPTEVQLRPEAKPMARQARRNPNQLPT